MAGPVFVKAGIVLEVPAQQDFVRGSEDGVEVHCRPVDDVEIGPDRHAVVGVVNANLLCNPPSNGDKTDDRNRSVI